MLLPRPLVRTHCCHLLQIDASRHLSMPFEYRQVDGTSADPFTDVARRLIFVSSTQRLERVWPSSNAVLTARSCHFARPYNQTASAAILPICCAPWIVPKYIPKFICGWLSM